MKLNRKLWTAALAVAMTTPSAMAAQDTAGMHYTSASEGFYASIRARYNSNGNVKGGGADIQNSSSRFGVRGTNDLGSGLEGFYQYEAGVGIDNGSSLSTRVGRVGLRGDFGAVVAGSFWTDSYNWVYGSTDVANMHSGAFAYGDFGQGRSKGSIQYTTPDLNGFQGGILLQADNSGKDDANDIDHWNASATYSIAGFSMGASYSNNADGIAGGVDLDHNKSLSANAKATRAMPTPPVSVIMGGDPHEYAVAVADFNAKRAEYAAAKKIADGDDVAVEKYFDGKDDLTSWAIKLAYSQDNWYVNGWYGEISHSDVGTASTCLDNGTGGGTAGDGMCSPGESGGARTALSFDDTEVFSLAGGISVDKVSIYAVYETKESSAVVGTSVVSQDDAYSTLGVQYTLGSNSWTWVEYAGQDLDSSESEDDTFTIGMGHSF